LKKIETFHKKIPTMAMEETVTNQRVKRCSSENNI